MVGLGSLLRILIIAVFTALEAAGLAVWLGFVLEAPLVSRAVAIGLGVLAVALFLEHVLTDVAVNGVDFEMPVGAIVVFSITEVVLWAVWLEVAQFLGGTTGLGAGFVVLGVLLVPQHTIEDNALRGDPLLAHFVNLGALPFSLIEAAGATVWLALVLFPGLVGGSVAGFPADQVGLAVLAVALFVEHTIGVRFARR